MFRLHQHLIGLRRRNPWLHAARNEPLQLTNGQYVYRTEQDEDALIVALNVDDAPLRVSLAELGIGSGRIVAGSGAPAEAVGRARRRRPARLGRHRHLARAEELHGCGIGLAVVEFLQHVDEIAVVVGRARRTASSTSAA